MTLPNFIIIGASKCGTDSLYQYLRAHPEIFIPDLKEPNFFLMKTIRRATLAPVIRRRTR
jgi:hypothetical protein